MTSAHSLIAAFLELNRSENRTIAHFTPSLIGMFGSAAIFDSFLIEIDKAIVSGQVPLSLKKRAVNLIGTFIPQVAEYNDVKNLSEITVSAEELKNVTADSLENRRNGITLILAALVAILKESNEAA